MNIFSFIGSVFKPAADLIDSMHTSEKEKLDARNKLFTLQAQAFAQAEEYEKKLLDAKMQIITAEAQSQSWIARNWRPISMLVFLSLVIADSFGWLANPLANEAWLLLQIGLGGYVVGRSGEKVAKTLKEMKG